MVKGFKVMKYIAYFLAILAVFVILRLPLFWTPVMDVDEAIYALFSRIWFGGGVPYVDCVETKPLGIYFIYGAIFEVFGYYNMLAIHIFTVIWMFVTSIFIYRITRMLSSDARAGLLAALFYAVFTTTYTPKIVAALIEPFMLLAVVLQVYFWMKYEEKPVGACALLSGFFFSCAIVMKYTAGIYFIMMLIYICLSPRKRFRGFLYFIAGAVPIPLAMVSYLYAKGSLPAFLFWTVSGSLDYVAGGSASIDVTKQLVTRVLPFLAGTAALWIFLAARVRGLTRKMADKREWLVWLWLVLSVAPVAAGKRFYGHYFLMLVPPLCILSAMEIRRWWKNSAVRYLVISFVILAGVGCLIPRFMMTSLYARLGEDDPKSYAKVASYVRAHTLPGDKILVWGFAPMIYLQSDRLPATRFFWSDLAAGRVPAARQDNGLALQNMPITRLAWKLFFEDMEKNRPLYFIDTSPAGFHGYRHFPIGDYPALSKYIDDSFTKEAVVDGAVIYKR